VGGAVISTPGVRLLGASPFEAVGTTLPAILPSAVAGTARYAREGLVDWPVVAATAPAGVLTAVASSYASHAVPGEGHLLMVMTAAILAVTAWHMGRGGPREHQKDPGQESGTDVPLSGTGTEATPDRRRSAAAGAGVGAVAGTLSGLLGVGGGTVLVPAFSEVMGMPLKSAIATSLACVGILAVPSTVAHALLDDIDWRLAALLAVAVVPGARLGAALAIRASHRHLRLAVAGILGATAFGYGAAEIVTVLR